MPKAATTEIRSRSLREEIGELLQRKILTGVYAPGERLVERELSEEFGVSSIPVREALQDLVNRGLVVKRHNYGCSVIQLTPEEVQRIGELRQALEPQVIRWAAERIKPGQIDELEAQLRKMADAASSGDLSAFFGEDLAFHQKVWEIADNPYAARALDSILGSLFVSGLRRREGGPAIDLKSEVSKHKAMVEALRRGDADGAVNALLTIARHFQNEIAKSW